jgi:type I restriction enzyme S subunit
MTRSLFPPLPQSWRSAPVKHAASLNPEVLPESTPEETEIFYVDIAALEGGEAAADLSPKDLTFGTAPSRARRVLRAGDTILSTVRTYLKAVANFPEASEGMVASTGFAVIRPNGQLHPRFAYWAVLSEPFIENVVAHSEGVSYPAINPSVLGTLHMPMPPLDDQEQIANFLDEQTARIDALIAEKEKLTVRLDEYRSSVISAAVTGQLGVGASEPAAAFPAQLLEAVGGGAEGGGVGVTRSLFPPLPQSWRSAPVKHAASLNPEVLPESTPEETEIFYVDIAALEGGEAAADLSPKDLTFGTAPSRARRVLRAGDTILSTVRTYLKAVANFPEASEGMVASTGFAVIRPNGQLHPRFAYWAVLSEPFIENVVAHSEGVSYPAINPSVLGTLHMPMPPLDDQEQIANFLDEHTKRIDQLKEHVKEHIACLREYRSSLISSAVTGQMDISAYKPS